MTDRVGNTEVGVFRPMHDGMLRAADELSQNVARFERGEIDYETAARENQRILRGLPDQERDALSIRAVLDRFSRAVEQRRQALSGADGVAGPEVPATSPQLRLVATLRSIRLPPGSNQRASDVAVSSQFPRGDELLLQLRGLSERQIDSALRAAGHGPEDRARLLQSLKNRAVVALAQQTLREVERGVSSLARQLSPPSARVVQQLVGELSGEARSAAIAGLGALGASEEHLEAVRRLSPPRSDAEAQALGGAVRAALSAAGEAVRTVLRELQAQGDVIGEWFQGDLGSGCAPAMRAAAARFGIHPAFLDPNGATIARQPTFVEAAIREHAERAAATRAAVADGVEVVKKLTNAAFTIVTGGAGLAASIVGFGSDLGVAAVEREIARKRATRAETLHRSGAATDADARAAQRAVRSASEDAVRAAASATVGHVNGDRSLIEQVAWGELEPAVELSQRETGRGVRRPLVP